AFAASGGWSHNMQGDDDVRRCRARGIRVGNRCGRSWGRRGSRDGGLGGIGGAHMRGGFATERAFFTHFKRTFFTHPNRRCVALPFVDRTASPYPAQPWDGGNESPGTETWALFDLR